MKTPNHLFLRITMHAVLILLPLITYYGIWGSYGSLAKHQIYLDNKAKTLDKKGTPCIVCGIPGYKRNYRKVGSGLSVPFEYEGPYIYCSSHTERTPLRPYKQGWEHFKRGLSFIIAFGMLLLESYTNIWKKNIREYEAKESWGSLGLYLGLFLFFFFY